MTRALTLILGGGHSGTIERAIVSALGQHTRDPGHVVVFASDDATLERARAFTADGRVTVERRDQDETPFTSVRAAVRAFDCEYLAQLDGDGWWTSPTKLQRQVDFLAHHEGCSISCHRTRETAHDAMLSDNVMDPQLSFGLADVIQSNVVPPCSAVVRASVFKTLPDWSASATVGLWPVWILAACRGRIALLGEEFAARDARLNTLADPRVSDEARVEPFVEMYEDLNRLLDFRYDDLFKAAASQPRWRWVVRAHYLRRATHRLRAEVDHLTEERHQLYQQLEQAGAEQARLWQQIDGLGRLAAERSSLYARIEELGRLLEAQREAAPQR